MLKGAEGDSRSIPLIVAEKFLEVNVETRTKMGKLESLKKVVRNHKGKNLIKDPLSLDELEVDESWKTYGIEEQPFLIHDSGNVLREDGKMERWAPQPI